MAATNIVFNEEVINSLKDVSTVTDGIQSIREAFEKFSQDSDSFLGFIATLTSELTTTLPAAFGVLEKAVELSGGSFEDLGKTLHPLLTTLKTNLPGALGAIAALAAIAAGVIAGMAAMFVHLRDTNEEFRADITAAWESIRESIGSVIESVTGIIEGFFAGITENGTMQSMADTFMSIWQPVEEFFAALFTSIGEIFAALFGSIAEFFTNHGTSIQEFFVNVWTFAWQQIEPILADVGTAIGFVGEVITTVTDVITAVAGPVIAMFVEVVGGMIAGIMEGVNLIIALFNGDWTAAWQSLKDIVKIAVDAVVSVLTGIVESISNVLTVLEEAVAGKWEEIKTAVLEKAGEIVESVTDFFGGLAEKIGAAVGQVIGALSQWCENVITWVTENIPAIIENIITFFAELPELLLTELLRVIDSFSEFVGDMIEAVQTEIPRIVDKITGFFGALPEKITEVGRDIVRGLIGGILEMSSWVQEQVSGFIEGIKNMFTGSDGFDSHSPSLWAERLGGYIGEGLANGITASSGAAAIAMRGLIDRMSAMTAGSVDMKVMRAIYALPDSITSMVPIYAAGRAVPAHEPYAGVISGSVNNILSTSGGRTNHFTQNIQLSGSDMSSAEKIRMLQIQSRRMLRLGV